MGSSKRSCLPGSNYNAHFTNHARRIAKADFFRGMVSQQFSVPELGRAVQALLEWPDMYTGVASEPWVKTALGQSI